MENDIQKSFDDSLIQTGKEIAIEMADVVIDQVLEEGLLRDIPIVSLFSNFVKMGVNIQDRLFLKKILVFFGNINDVPSEKRAEMINKIDESGDYRIRVGEKLLYILDSCNDHENVENVAKFFKAFITGRITYDEFLKGVEVLKRINSQDLNYFLLIKSDFISIEEVSTLMEYGLFIVYFEDVEVRTEQTEYSDYEAITTGGKVMAEKTLVGKKIQEVLG